MPRPASDQPTELELQILGVLWDKGECTVREVHNHLTELRGADYAYASTVKMLHVMLEKELVTRDDSIRPQVFKAKITQKRTQRSMLKDLVQKAYAGSSATVILQALSDRQISRDELQKIREMLDQRESHS